MWIQFIPIILLTYSSHSSPQSLLLQSRIMRRKHAGKQAGEIKKRKTELTAAFLSLLVALVSLLFTPPSQSIDLQCLLLSFPRCVVIEVKSARSLFFFASPKVDENPLLCG